MYLQLEYEYEKVRIKYEDTQANTWCVAVPDFYLPETNTLVEIKSEYTYDKQNMEDKECIWMDGKSTERVVEFIKGVVLTVEKD